MISKFLIKSFIKDYENIDNPDIRERYGYLGGVVGIFSNILLFIVKFFVGTVTNSIAVSADAFNNLSDVLSSVITVLGFKLASKPADEEHPYGHGRIEYISALIIASLVLLVGFSFLKASIDKIRNPEPVNFEIIPFSLLLISVGIKFWLSRFNMYVGKAINSSALKASSVDALSDVFSSATVALSLLVSTWIDFPIDGIMGILVSGFILYSGYNILKETIDDLLGTRPSNELVKNIEQELLKYNPIIDVHDLIIHTYGPNKYMASIHVEVPSNSSIVEIHDVIDQAEREVSNKFNVLLVIHMDPVVTDDKEVAAIRHVTEEILKKFDVIESYHDFRVVESGDHKNVIFDAVIKVSKSYSRKDKENLEKAIDSYLKDYDPNLNGIITIEQNFNKD
jgi:cation diffusion facilitator family transporter